MQCNLQSLCMRKQLESFLQKDYSKPVNMLRYEALQRRSLTVEEEMLLLRAQANAILRSILIKPPEPLRSYVVPDQLYFPRKELLKHTAIVADALLQAGKKYDAQLKQLEDAIRALRPPPPPGWRTKHRVEVSPQQVQAIDELLIDGLEFMVGQAKAYIFVARCNLKTFSERTYQWSEWVRNSHHGIGLKICILLENADGSKPTPPPTTQRFDFVRSLPGWIKFECNERFDQSTTFERSIRALFAMHACDCLLSPYYLDHLTLGVLQQALLEHANPHQLWEDIISAEAARLKALAQTDFIPSLGGVIPLDRSDQWYFKTFWDLTKGYCGPIYAYVVRDLQISPNASLLSDASSVAAFQIAVSDDANGTLRKEIIENGSDAFLRSTLQNKLPPADLTFLANNAYDLTFLASYIPMLSTSDELKTLVEPMVQSPHDYHWGITTEFATVLLGHYFAVDIPM